MSTVGKNVALGVTVVLLTFVVGEVGARAVLPAPYRIRSRKPSSMKAMPKFVADPDLGWVNAPEDATYHFVSAGRSGTADAFYHMRGGFRETSTAPQNGPILIAAGCSFTFGMGVNDADTWPWLVQEQMPGDHIVNAATEAYGAGQALMRADQVIERNPGKVGAVLFAFADFQVGRDQANQRDLLSLYPLGRPRFLISGDGIRREGIVRFWTPGPILERSSLVMSVTNHLAESGNKTPDLDEAIELETRIIEDFARRAQTRKIPFGVIVLPNGSDTGPIATRIRNFVVPRLRNSGIPTFVPEFPRGADGKIDKAKYTIPSDEFHPNREFNVIFSKPARESLETLLRAAAPGQ